MRFKTTCLLVLFQLFTFTVNAQIPFTDDGGFTTKPERWIEKRVLKSERKHGAAIASAFEQNMRELSHFADWTVVAFNEAKSEFGQCFDVSGISPSQLHITIEAGPFPVAGYEGLYSGVAYENGSIHIAYWNLSDRYGTQFAVALLRGEVRNWFNWHLTGKPKEMWSVPACGH